MKARRALLVLFAINLLNFYDRQALAALTEPVRKEFSLTDTQIGWMTTSFTLLYAFIGVPLGRLADRADRKKLLAGGVSLWSLLTGATALASGFGWLLFTRLGVAVGEAVCGPAGTSWLGDQYPAEKRARALSLFMMAVPIGGALSFFLSGPAAQAFGWRVAMALAAAPALLLVPALLTLEQPARGIAAPNDSVWRLARIPTLWWIIASGAILNFALYAFAAFLASFLMRVHGFALGTTGIVAGSLYGAGGALGGIVAGRIGDRVIHVRKDGRMLVAALAALMAAPVSYFAILEPAAAAIPLLGLTYGLLSMYYGLVYASLHDIVPAAQRGTALAFYFLMMYLCGASFGPVITGNLSDHLARRAAGSSIMTETFRAIGLRQAMLIIPAMALVLAVVLYAGSRSMRKQSGAGF